MYFLYLGVFLIAFINQGCSEIVNSKVDRSIDIASQLVKTQIKLTLENTGKSPVSSFFFALEPNTKQYLAYIGASQLKSENKINLEVEDGGILTNNPYKDKDVYNIILNSPLTAGSSTVVHIETVLTYALEPYPSSITQSEKQLVVFNGNHYFYSPYVTKSQTTEVTLPSTSVESYSKLKPFNLNGNKLQYGEYQNIEPFMENKMTIHCENNNPFLSVLNLNRTIEVSHWGMISIEEVVDLGHLGSVLKGPFSRYDFQRDQSGMASVKTFKTVLPASASDVYYRDEIGNISTSHLRILEDSVEVELRPRFPLFGGWKTHYVLGYYVPTYEYLFNRGDEYVLKMRLVDHVFDDSIIQEAYVRVILPEGSKNIELKLPYTVTRCPDELHYTYLDTVGRPVIVLNRLRLVEQHIQEFEVHYNYKKILMLQEPLLVVVALYLLFILVIVYVRLDFSITQDPTKQSKLQVARIVENIHNHCDTRADIYKKLDETIAKFKHSRDLSSYQAAMRKLNTEHKTETHAVSELLQKLKHEGSEIAEKVAELQRYDKSLKEQFQQQMVLAEKLVSGKINKQQFVDSEMLITKKKTELVEKISGILYSL